MRSLSHLDEKGAARMVDIAAKAATFREATAEATVHLSRQAFRAVSEGRAPKGDVIAAARIAGIMAAKKVPALIPLCHSIAITRASLDFEFDGKRRAIRILATVAASGRTGVEMEALTAVSVAALTLYDMIKGVDKSTVVESIRLLAKSGGKSGTYRAPALPRAAGRLKPKPHR
ncbi:MAG: cyclic pyranopterin monophosphate synthase MoaC [Rhizomicrobium sp.]